MTTYDDTRVAAEAAWQRVKEREAAVRDDVTHEVSNQPARYEHIINRYRGDVRRVVNTLGAQRADEDALVKAHVAAYDRTVNTAVMYGLGDIINLLTRVVQLLEEDR